MAREEGRLRHLSVIMFYCCYFNREFLLKQELFQYAEKEKWHQITYCVAIPVKRWKQSTFTTGRQTHWGQVHTLQIPLALPVLFSYCVISGVGLQMLPQPTSLDCQALRNKGTNARSSWGGGLPPTLYLKETIAFLQWSVLLPLWNWENWSSREKAPCLALTLVIKSNHWSLDTGQKNKFLSFSEAFFPNDMIL